MFASACDRNTRVPDTRQCAPSPKVQGTKAKVVRYPQGTLGLITGSETLLISWTNLASRCFQAPDFDLTTFRGDIGDWHSEIFDQASDNLGSDLR
jgi:hypothetical protein